MLKGVLSDRSEALCPWKCQKLKSDEKRKRYVSDHITGRSQRRTPDPVRPDHDTGTKKYAKMLLFILMTDSDEKSYDYLLRYIIVGDIAVGKSCILLQFMNNKFRVAHELTIGVEFGVKIIDLKV